MVRDVKAGGSLSYSGHEMVKFGILGGGSRAGSVEEEMTGVSCVKETPLNIMFLLKKYRA